LDIRDFLIFIKKIIYLLKKNKINKIILNLGSGKTTSINKVIYLCKKKFNLNIKLNFIEISNKEIMITKANINKSKKTIKWNPRITILSSLKSYSNSLK
jgi:UDP-glucose 4-epimerase